jgi:hypothetical protein
MKIRLIFPIFITIAISAFGQTAAQTAKEPERTMGVSAGPELVFSQPVNAMLSQLNGAVATHENGRVGNELVFWGYRMEDGSESWLFACAPLEGVDCPTRTLKICPAGSTRIIVQTSEQGLVRELNCRVVGQAGIGDLRPGCSDIEKLNALLVGLAACH